MTDPTAETAAELVAAEPVVNEASGEATDDGCSATNLATKSELAFVQACIAEQIATDALLAVIQNAKSAQKCGGVAQRLYANRAQGGDSKVALAYAREYDPSSTSRTTASKKPTTPLPLTSGMTPHFRLSPIMLRQKQRYEELRVMATTRSLRCSAALLLLLGGTGAVVAETTSEHRPLLQEGKKEPLSASLDHPRPELVAEAVKRQGCCSQPSKAASMSMST